MLHTLLRRTCRRTAVIVCSLAVITVSARAQFKPVNGIRPADLRAHAIVGATVVPAPGARIDNATIVIRDGVIEACGANVVPPPDARRWPGDGLTVYAGFVDAAVLVDTEALPDAPSRHWNEKIRPELRMAEQPALDAKVRSDLRDLGFTTAAVYPKSGIFRGRGTVIALAERPEHVLAYTADAAQAAAFERSGNWSRPATPGSLMGSIALARQTLLDAQWYAKAQAVYAAHPEGNEPPPPADAFAALGDVVAGERMVLFEVDDELNALRAARLADEFGLQAALLGSGMEFRRLGEIAALELPVIVPVRFPDRPNVSNLGETDSITLRTMMTWEQAPTNPRRLVDAGVHVALTTHRLDKRSGFPEAVRKAVDHGLERDDMLAALTTAPAALLGLDHVMGTIEPGKIANLVVVDGELFAKKTKVRDTWINGRRSEVTPPSDPVVAFAGMLQSEGGHAVDVALDTGKPSMVFTAPGGREVKAKKVIVIKDRVAATVDATVFGLDGYVRLAAALTGGEMTGILSLPSGERVPFSVRSDGPEVASNHHDDGDDAAPDEGHTAIAGRWEGDLEDANGESIAFTLELDDAGDPDMVGHLEASGFNGKVVETSVDAARQMTVVTIEVDGEPATAELTMQGETMSGTIRGAGRNYDVTAERVVAPTEHQRAAKRGGRGGVELPPNELVVPLGAYGMTDRPQPQTVHVRGATIWTAGPAGIIEDGDLLVENGEITQIGNVRNVPPDALVIEAKGRHVTPGMIDCHSHTGISGGVNEFPEANTAEVRIGDVVNPDDVNWYRQLAGGLTAAHQLHGSANPIGGQDSVVKLRWGGTADDLVITEASQGIKFALGENVKRRSGRYPDTRMGVESFIRDAFTAAREYENALRRYESLPTEERQRTMPPRRDLELDTLVEILGGDRIVHCHSYRQDEILMLIRVASEFGFTIGTFQHVLEGYKVAEAIADHGAGASSFSDWWAYKVEVMDAIPHNGTLLADVGVLVSFNSDSSELARRMNTEAAKAVRYGGLEPHEALKFVTINPALQLGIGDRTGSLEVGKDADFVIWSTNPLSTYARCEQTWIEGARYFDLETDMALRARTHAERERLVQKMLAQTYGDPDSGTPDAAPRRTRDDQPTQRRKP